MNTQTHTICHNPACHRELNRGDAFLRSVSLVQVAFCSLACVAVFNSLDGLVRLPIPEQRVSDRSARISEARVVS